MPGQYSNPLSVLLDALQEHSAAAVRNAARHPSSNKVVRDVLAMYRILLNQYGGQESIAVDV